jgi:amino acid adenylation domain-containing protein
MSEYSRDLSDLSPEKRALLELLLAEQGSKPTVFPLSFAQQRLWFLDQLEPDTAAYNIPTAVRLAGKLDFHALSQSLNHIVQRHESLRTTFAVIDGQPVQLISPSSPLEIAVEDLSLHSEADRIQLASQVANQEAQKPFDLSTGPLLRVKVLKLGEDDHVVVMVMHHIVSDGWSSGILINELVGLYDSYSKGKEAELPPLEIQYGDFAQWQREWMSGEVLDAQLSYWRKQLTGAPPVIELPIDKPRPPLQTYRGATESFTVSKAVVAGLKALSQQEAVTMFMTLLAAFKILLQRHTSQADIVVGTPIANRNRVELEPLIGFFSNMLVLRTDLSDHPSFRRLLGRVREMALGAYAHQDVPFEKLVDELQAERDLQRTPLFQVCFVYQGAGGNDVQMPLLALSPIATDTNTAKFELTLTLMETGDGLLGQLQYNTDLFARETIMRMIGHFTTLLEGVVADPNAPISRLPILTAQERRQLLEVWNDPRVLYPQAECLHRLFEQQAERAPQATAVVFEDQCLSYEELNHRANQLARYLQALGVGPESLVGIFMERSVEMIVAILGILKAGGAYVPLDPTYPKQRLEFMIDDSRAALLLSQQSMADRLPAHNAHAILLDSEWEKIAGESRENLASAATSENTAYVIYTSGSTGKPKGVMVTHQNVARLFESTAHWFNFDDRDVWTMFHSYAFDFSVWEIWGALMYGGRLVVVPYWVSRTPESFYELLSAQQVTVLNQTPSAFRQLTAVDEAAAPGKKLALRFIVFGGEALELQSLKPWFDHHGDENPQLINMYGITETTVHVSYRRIKMADVSEGKGSVIGGPINDLQIYVLDDPLQPAPVGISGEMFVGGGGVARGYLNRADLTAERFIPHPFAGRPGERLYKTGDLARYLSDGDIQYLGRQDHQVKIRGFRIELGEIEAALSGQASVQESVVVVREDEGGEKRLIGYVVEKAGEAQTTTEIREQLKQGLPDYMVPSAIVKLREMPLTPNGKIDRRALPAPGRIRTASEGTFEPPRNAAEQTLTEIWSAVLGVERVGITDNFFALGGDSIISIRVLALAKEKGLDFSLQQLFKHQTIKELVPEIATSDLPPVAAQHTSPFSLISEEDRLKLPEDVEDAYPLTMMQVGMIYHMELTPEEPVYHNVNSIRLRTPFDLEAFDRAVKAVVARHAALRTSFDVTGFSEPLQLVRQHAELPIDLDDLRHLPTEEADKVISQYMASESNNRFDLSEPPLLRFKVHRLTDDEIQFTLTECHLIFDGWSLHSTLAEIFECYNALLDGKELPNQETIATSFSDFVLLERQEMASPESRQFWTERLSDCVITHLPEPLSAIAVPASPRVRTHNITISEQVTEGLNDLAQTAGATLKSVLLSAHLKVMSLMTGQTDILTGLTTHGRPDEIDGERVRGLFLNTMPFRLQLRPSTWMDLVRQTFDAEREYLPYRRYPLAAIQASIGVQSLFDTLFNYVHFHVVDGVLQSGKTDVIGFKKTEETSFKLLVGWGPHLLTTGLDIELEYNSAALSKDQILAMAGYYERVLTAMASEPYGRHESQSFLPAAELQRILIDFNDTKAEHPTGRCIHQLFEAQVMRTPEAAALIYEDRKLSYAELNSQANQVAHYLQGMGVGREDKVGVLMQRGIEMMAAILGVLKAGAAYVPLDPAYPKQRLAFMLEDSHAPVLITQERFAEFLPVHNARSVCLEIEWEAISRMKVENPDSQVTEDNLGYVIYTSGSTGLPKGVAIEHRSAVTLLHWAREAFDRDELAGVLASTSICFDLSVYEIFVPLSCGGKVILAQNALHLPSLPAAKEVTLINTVPSAMAGLLKVGGVPDTVRTINLAGEPLAKKLVDDIYQLDFVRQVFNLYGPTEDTTYSTFALASKGSREAPTIGLPLDNTQAYILDRFLQPVPAGAPGQLYLAGAGLARGYLNRPELTAERFIPDPFSKTPDGRMYNTGDVARYLADGDIQYLGRQDHQVKIRGFRIELGEIEAALSGQASVQESVVVVREDEGGEKRLIGYVVEKAGEAQTTTEIREQLKQGLPDYMVPSAIVKLREMPLTPNGKIDRRALPAPDSDRPDLEAAYAAPETEAERIIAEIWQEVLGLDSVGVNDNFFDLGGHSLQMIQAHAKVREVFNRDVSMLEMFQYPTIKLVARYLSRNLDEGPSFRESQDRAETRIESAKRQGESRRKHRAALK